MPRAMCAFGIIALVATANCAPVPAQPSMPEAFGVTMVEETTCIGQGGQIVMGPDGAFCAGS